VKKRHQLAITYLRKRQRHVTDTSDYDAEEGQGRSYQGKQREQHRKERLLGQYVHIPAQEVTTTAPAAVTSKQTSHPDQSTQMQDEEDDDNNSDEGRKITGRPLYVILVRKYRGQAGRN
jgi:hypothetical protein